jgi:hypothetical protein
LEILEVGAMPDYVTFHRKSVYSSCEERMMVETRENTPALGWRSMLFAWVGIVVATGLALLVIEQLSLRAALQGAVIAMGAVVFGRVVLYLWSRKH